MTARRLTVALTDLAGGGAERLQLGLAPHFAAAGWEVTLLLQRRCGALLADAPHGIALASLDADRQIAALPGLVAHLRLSRPDILVTNTEHGALTALAAKVLSRSPTRIVVVQHSSLRRQVDSHGGWRYRALPPLLRRALPQAAAIIAVSEGVADELARIVNLPRDRVTAIPNGVRLSDHQGPRHPWFGDGRGPVLLAIGRLVPQKDFATLIRTIAQLSAVPAARLVILGEGPQRADLVRLVRELGLRDRVALPGFCADPSAMLQAADLFVSTSRYEGFGNAIAEALLAGTRVVATDCSFGPAEILDGGRYGRLVPVADEAALAKAITASLAGTPDKSTLRARGAAYSLERCAAAYLALFDRLTPRR